MHNSAPSLLRSVLPHPSLLHLPKRPGFRPTEQVSNPRVGSVMSADRPGFSVPIGSIVVPFWGSVLESDKVIPKRNYHGACGYRSGESGTAFRRAEGLLDCW